MKIHAFPFSARRGTPAAEFPEQVPAHVRKDRLAQLAELEGRLARRYYGALVGKRLTVLVEARPAAAAGCVLGTACRYVPVELPGCKTDVGELIEVAGHAVRETVLYATRGESRACR